MNNVKKVKIIKIILSIFGLIIFSSAIFIYALLWNSSYDTPKVKVSSTLVDEIMLAQKQGKTLEVNNEKFNELISMYIKPGSFSGVTIKGIGGEITGDSVKLNMPVNVKGFNLFLSSQGNLSYKDNKVQYKPLYFKVGKITLPRSFTMNKLKAHLPKGMLVDSDSIYVDKSAIPIKLHNIYAKNNQLFIVVDKTVNNLEEQAKAAVEKATTLQKGSNGTSSASNSAGSSTGFPVQGGTSSGISQSDSKNSANPTEMDSALNRISSGLNSATGSVSSGSGKAVISQVISVVNSMKGNPSANPYEYAGSVRASYSKLSPSEKAELKSAIFSNVNGSDVNVVSKILGK
jgi:hypothetical protein